MEITKNDKTTLEDCVTILKASNYPNTAIQLERVLKKLKLLP